MFLSKDDFSLAVNLVPLISVDFCLLDSSNKLLFVKRNCSPAKDFFFTPGGRIRKNEKFDDAIKRISTDEVGIPLNANLGMIKMGVWDHFYPDSAYDKYTSTHYINIPLFLRLEDSLRESLIIKIGKDLQHNDFEWIDIKKCLNIPGVHDYAKEYANFIFKNYIKI